MLRVLRTGVHAIWIAALLAACSGSGPGDFGGGTTGGSSSGSSDDTSVPTAEPSGGSAAGNGNCFRDSSGCECRSSSSPTAGQTKASTCGVDDGYVGCCAVPSASGSGYSSCFCRTAKSAGGSSLKCLSTTTAVSSCDDLTFVAPKKTSGGCQSDSECVGGCRAGESYFCNKASGYGTCDCR